VTYRERLNSASHMPLSGVPQLSGVLAVGYVVTGTGGRRRGVGKELILHA
jgi:hypothetical protein